MNYEKPNFAVLALAVESIKGQGKGEDNIDMINQLDTISAYESDE
jgi:hypothetical protein